MDRHERDGARTEPSVAAPNTIATAMVAVTEPTTKPSAAKRSMRRVSSEPTRRGDAMTHPNRIEYTEASRNATQRLWHTTAKPCRRAQPAQRSFERGSLRGRRREEAAG